jgi:hypothetical protein
VLPSLWQQSHRWHNTAARPPQTEAVAAAHREGLRDQDREQQPRRQGQDRQGHEDPAPVGEDQDGATQGRRQEGAAAMTIITIPMTRA